MVVVGRQPVRIADAHPDGGYTSMYEIICCSSEISHSPSRRAWPAASGHGVGEFILAGLVTQRDAFNRLPGTTRFNQRQFAWVLVPPGALLPLREPGKPRPQAETSHGCSRPRRALTGHREDRSWTRSSGHTGGTGTRP